MVGHSGTTNDAMVAATRTPIFIAGPSRCSAEVPGTARNTRPPRRGRAGGDVAACPGEAPGMTTVPSVTSIVRVHARPMSSRSCEMTTSVRPSLRRMCPRSSSSPRRLSRSRPARGSSRTSTRGRDARSPAIATRRIWPPLSSSTLRPARSAGSPTRTGSSERRRRSSSEASFAWNPAAARMSSATVGRCSCSLACWNDSATVPTDSAAGVPSIVTVPSVGLISPASTQASVDLPDPFSPVIRSPSPSRTSRSTERSAVTSQGVPASNRWPTPRTRMTGSPGVPGA